MWRVGSPASRGSPAFRASSPSRSRPPRCSSWPAATLFVALAVEAAALHYLARRAAVKAASSLAHGLFVVVGFWLLARLALSALEAGLDDHVSWSLPGLDGIANLAVLALIAASSLYVSGTRTVLVYRIAAHAGLLAWIWCEPTRMPGSAGDALVTVAWGAIGAGLFVAGLRRDHAYLIKAGMATLFLVVGKLLLWDLAWAEPILRVLLFLGFGGLFLVLSYHLRNLWNPSDREEVPEGTPELPKKQEEPSHSRP